MSADNQELKIKPSDYEATIVLSEALSLIENGWIQHASAIDADGESVELTDPSACKFCGGGAIERSAIQNGLLSQYAYFYDLVDQQLPPNGYDLTYYNDGQGRTQSEVTEVFKKAIQVLKSKTS